MANNPEYLKVEKKTIAPTSQFEASFEKTGSSGQQVEGKGLKLEIQKAGRKIEDVIGFWKSGKDEAFLRSVKSSGEARLNTLADATAASRRKGLSYPESDDRYQAALRSTKAYFEQWQNPDNIKRAVESQGEALVEDVKTLKRVGSQREAIMRELDRS